MHPSVSAFVRMLRAVLAVAAVASCLACRQTSQSLEIPKSAYVDANVCAGCHAEIAKTYRTTGMAQAFHRPTKEDLSRTGAYFHPPSDRQYEMVVRDGRLFQRRSQNSENLFELEVHYVLGSGNRSRTYLHRTAQGKLLELPLAWYAEKGGYWAMNPGYDRPDHRDFSRAVTNPCMFCHNGYGPLADSPARPGEDALFPAGLAAGIDCQRCHGPGRAHVEAASAQRDKSTVQALILHPGKLSRDRQLEVCMQCHLETTSRTLPYAIVRYDRGLFSYKPSEELSSYILHFDHAEGKGPDNRFEIAHAAYRLRKSACFARSKSMTCTTCHDPHQVFRGNRAVERYKAACRQCHAAAHKKDEDCMGCHMPRRRTDDVVHVIMTDHFIQRRKPARDLLAPLAEKHDTAQSAYRGPVVPYYPKSMKEDIYLAIAQVSEGSNVEEGIRRLEPLTAQATEGLVFHELAEAYWKTGAVDNAIANYEKALRLRPTLLPSIRNLGNALMAKGDNARAVEVLSRVPDDAASLANLGEANRRQGNHAEAIAALRRAADLDPVLPEARFWLGRALEDSGAADARRAYEEAIRIKPNYAEAHYYLGTLLGRSGDRKGGEKHLLAAVRYNPSLADAYNNLGNLAAQAGQAEKAVAYFGKTVALNPEHYAAHLNLGMALAELGRPEAASHFRQAAKSGDPRVRAAAGKALQYLGGR
jgi:predicted CXXCH cytochrome family protein